MPLLTRSSRLRHALLLFAMGGARTAWAQPADDLRGRVTTDSARAVPGATVFVTRGSDRAVQQTSTDADGRWRVRFDPGTGDYLVFASAVGFQSARRRVQRVADEREFVVDLVLRPVTGTTLAQVTVRSGKPRPDNGVRLGTEEVGASEKWVDGVSAAIAPTARGDLTALAATVPGLVLGAGGASSLGAAPSSALTTLNGVALPAGQLPRGASVDARFSAGTMDATRGGFAGGQLELRVNPGNRDYQRRRAWIAADGAALQATDAIGRNTGAPVTGARFSLGANGEAIRRAVTYDVSVDVARAASDPASLLDASDATRALVALSPDSARRVTDIARNLPLSLGGAERRVSDNWGLLARVDDTRDTTRVLALTGFLSVAQRGALEVSPVVAPGAARTTRDASAALQLLHQRTGRQRALFNENRASLSRSTQRGASERALPAAIVLADAQDGTTVLLGGNAAGDRDRAQWTLEGASEWSWQGTSRAHRFRAIGWGRADLLRDASIVDRDGSWRFASLGDLAANRPAAFTRTLAQPVRQGGALNAATALAHLWTPSPRLQLISGARLEANSFLRTPDASPAVSRSLGVRTDVAPARVHVSPRVGLTWTLPSSDTRSAQFFPSYATIVRPTMGVVRAGIGEFRDLYAASTVAGVSAGSAETLTCVGASTPVPNWAALAADPAAAPAQCVGGPSTLAQRAPSRVVLSPRYDVPRSWRAHLNYSTAAGPLLLRVEGAGALNLQWPSTVDRNLDASVRGRLLDEGRALFVPVDAIDPRSGAVSAVASRRDAALGTVRELRSDLRSTAMQFSVTATSDLFRLRNQFYSASWTVQRVRQQYRGADGANAGDPLQVEWAPGVFDERHTMLLQAAVPLPKQWGRLTLFSRVQSGLPFTPIVQGDVDGDGVAGDRAFVFDPATDPDPVRAAGMRELLGRAPAAVRRCLTARLGAMAARQACTGPWTATTNARVDVSLPTRLVGRRVQLSLNVANLAGGLDLLLHGRAARGWGNPALPDPVLLVPRGFDAAAGRYRYAVNPRFGSTRPAQSLLREPFRVTVDLTIDGTRPLAEQRLARTLEPQRREGGRWVPPTIDDMVGAQMRQVSSVHRLLLAFSDTLFLTRDQIERLQAADSTFQREARALFRPLAERLAVLPSDHDRAAVLADVRAVELAYQRRFWAQREVVRTLLTPLQASVMPEILKMIMAYTMDADPARWPRWFFADDGSRAGVGGPP